MLSDSIMIIITIFFFLCCRFQSSFTQVIHSFVSYSIIQSLFRRCIHLFFHSHIQSNSNSLFHRISSLNTLRTELRSQRTILENISINMGARSPVSNRTNLMDDFWVLMWIFESINFQQEKAVSSLFKLVTRLCS